MSKFPDYFPEDFESYLPNGVEYKSKAAYRLALFGVENPDSYLPTIKSDKLRGVKRTKKLSIPDSYSTSCFTTLDRLMQLRNTAFKGEPDPDIAYGVIEPEHGPTYTSDRGHIDWWIYQGVHPERFFRKEQDKDER